MKNLHRILLISATCAASATMAFADVPGVSLEYAGYTRIDGTTKPIATFKNYTSVEQGRIRKLTKYVIDTPKMSHTNRSVTKSPLSTLADMSRFNAGGIGVMIDRSNDKFMLFSTDAKSYIEQPYMDFLRQVRFDPFSKVAPELSKETPPELTAEQRKRLGAEVNIATKAFLKDNFKVYFRALPNSRNFTTLDGVPTHGYRMTMLFNTAKSGQPARWGKVASEWWVADSLPGDEMIRDFTGGMFDDVKRSGGISTSMWINEALPLIWSSLPQEFRDAVETTMPLPPAEDAWYKGTLAYMAITADLRQVKPAHQAIMRTEITLKERNTAAIPDYIFLPPAGYEKQDIGFLLAMYHGLSASLLDPSGPLAKIMEGKELDGNLPFGAIMPFLSPIEPVLNSPFTKHFTEAAVPRW